MSADRERLSPPHSSFLEETLGATVLGNAAEIVDSYGGAPTAPAFDKVTEFGAYVRGTE